MVILLSFLGSFGLFIFGISLLSSALQKTAGKKMKHILGNVSKSRFRGVLFGAGVTALIQSSTATTVMAVGFVNAGIIALPHIVGIIMGANVGSTVTSWLVASVEWSKYLKPDAIGAVCAATGALILLFCKKKSTKNIGEVIVGFGVLFIGLSQMPAALRPLAELDAVHMFFVKMGSNPILGILAGILVTSIIQSSAASIGILQSMAFTGMVPWNAAVYIILGQNIGTCLTAILSSVGTSKNACATSYVHLVYNVIGATIFCVAAVIYFAFINPAFGVMAITITNISMVHTGYNVAALILLFPFGRLILKIAEKMAGIDKHSLPAEISDLPELDESILETPSFALDNSINSIYKLMDLVRANLVLIVNSFINKDYKKIEAYWYNANDIDKVNDKISAFLKKLYNENLTKEDIVVVTALINSLISLKRISNRTKGFAKLAEEMRDSGIKYSNDGLDRVIQIYDMTLQCYDNMVKAFESHDIETISLTMQNADSVDYIRNEYKSEQLLLASGGGYSVETGILFAEAARHMARIAHNIKSIAESILNGDVMEDNTIDKYFEIELRR
ncbi:MAG: Na/Pi cotransporter family protein [Clostridiales bacterium]|nr:Na/Pi cotransporter family protein [Clostridiales bacterium]